MLRLTFGNNVRQAHPVSIYGSDNRGRLATSLVGIWNEGDLCSLHPEFALVGLIEKGARTYRRLWFLVLAVIPERGDETPLGTQSDERLLELEPVLPPILGWNTLDSRQGMPVEKSTDEKPTRRSASRAQGRGYQHRECQQKTQFHMEGKIENEADVCIPR